jgi:hypothetical protein
MGIFSDIVKPMAEVIGVIRSFSLESSLVV